MAISLPYRVESLLEAFSIHRLSWLIPAAAESASFELGGVPLMGARTARSGLSETALIIDLSTNYALESGDVVRMLEQCYSIAIDTDSNTVALLAIYIDSITNIMCL